MKIEIHLRPPDGRDPVREYLVRRIHGGLSRFNGEVTSVAARLTSCRDAADKPVITCRMTVRGPSAGTIAVEEVSTSLRQAVDHAVDRAARSVGFEIGRARAARRNHRPVGRAS